MTKSEIRKMILAKRDGLPKEQRTMASMVLTDRILGHQWFYRAKKVLCFVNYGSEISTEELITEALRMGKQIYVPKVEGENMVFYRIASLEELAVGYKGIREPKGDTECYEYQEEAEDTLLIMPGVAFDRYRNRIGYGKGFYDRFLADKEALQIHSIGVGFQCQMVEELPAEETDIRPYQVICV